METAFNQIRRDIASSSNIPDISASDDVEELEDHADRINSAIRLVSSMGNTLRGDRATIRRRMNQLNDDDPISKLPPEILGHIFQSINKNLKPEYVRYSERSLLAATHVSTHWRQVALTTPSLWTYISLVGNRRAEIPKLRAYLQRSGTLPLSIHVGELTDDTYDVRVTQLITPHLRRLASLDATGSPTQLSGLITDLAESADPSESYGLESLTATALRGWDDDFSVPRIPSIELALFRNLRRLMTFGIEWEGWEGWRLESLVLRIDVAGGGEEEVAASFANRLASALKPLEKGLPSLRRLQLMAGGEVPNLEVQRRYHLPQLTEIQLSMDGLQMESIFSALDAPLLTKVELTFRETSNLGNLGFLSRFSARYTPIRQLVLNKAFSLQSSDTMAYMVANIPSLEELTISGIAKDPSNHLDALSALPRAMMHLPNLRTLRVEKGYVHFESLRAALGRLDHRITLHLQMCTLHVLDMDPDRSWLQTEIILRTMLEERADIGTWKHVRPEYVSEAGEFMYS